MDDVNHYAMDDVMDDAMDVVIDNAMGVLWRDLDTYLRGILLHCSR